MVRVAQKQIEKEYCQRIEQERNLVNTGIRRGKDKCPDISPPEKEIEIEKEKELNNICAPEDAPSAYLFSLFLRCPNCPIYILLHAPHIRINRLHTLSVGAGWAVYQEVEREVSGRLYIPFRRAHIAIESILKHDWLVYA